MRVVTWNVRDLLGDPLHVRTVITALQPDVLCLQEAPRSPVPRASRIRYLAHQVGLRYIAGGLRSGWTAMLVSPCMTVHQVKVISLPEPAWYAFNRGSVIATLSEPTSGSVPATQGEPGAPTKPTSVPLTIAVTHLPLREDTRREHARTITAAVRQQCIEPGTAVITGDFNQATSLAATEYFGELVRDPAPDAEQTFPAINPLYRIDGILVGDHIQVSSYGLGSADTHLTAVASDHLPVTAVLSY